MPYIIAQFFDGDNRMKPLLRKYRLLLYWLVMFGVSLLARLVTSAIVGTAWRWDIALACAAIYATVWVGGMQVLKHWGIFGVRPK